MTGWYDKRLSDAYDMLEQLRVEFIRDGKTWHPAFDCIKGAIKHIEQADVCIEKEAQS